MKKGRMEAFSDGVIAILITIMVLEFRIPDRPTAAALCQMAPQFLGYVLSFVFIGIYWNNHHHMLQAVTQVDGGILWANQHLLFWLSLVPFVTSWMGHTNWAPFPVACYGIVLLGAGSAYAILSLLLVRKHGKDSVLARAVGRSGKEIASVVAYILAIFLAFVDTRLSGVLYVGVAVLWLVPDRRIERVLLDHPSQEVGERPSADAAEERSGN